MHFDRRSAILVVFVGDDEAVDAGDRICLPRMEQTAASDLELQIPKSRAGLFFPRFLERCWRVDQALFALVIQAHCKVLFNNRVMSQSSAVAVKVVLPNSEVLLRPTAVTKS